MGNQKNIDEEPNYYTNTLQNTTSISSRKLLIPPTSLSSSSVGVSTNFLTNKFNLQFDNNEDKYQQEYLSLSLSPPLNRRGMPTLRGSYVSL